ncbi:hypothetical protein PAXRUDRAFT_836073, partial [Paxillus rubicundulus Ve08.2h10]
ALSPRHSVVHRLLAVHFKCLVHEVPHPSFTDFWQSASNSTLLPGTTHHCSGIG